MPRRGPGGGRVSSVPSWPQGSSVQADVGAQVWGGAEAGSAWAPQAMGRCPASIQAHLCPLSRDLPTALGTTKVSEVETSSVTTSARNRSGI